MAYIGKQPEFTQYPSKFFNGDGSAMTVTLDYAPPNDAALLVFIDGVRQDTSAYNCTGTSCTFTGSVPSGTNNVQVVHMGLTVDVGVPGDDTVTTVKIQDDAVTTDKLANSINTEIAANTAKVTNATHTGDVTGATALTIANDAVDIAMLSATGTASSTTILYGDNTWKTEPAGGATSQSSAPTATAGAFWHDTSESKLKMYDGTAWFLIKTLLDGSTLAKAIDSSTPITALLTARDEADGSITTGIYWFKNGNGGTYTFPTVVSNYDGKTWILIQKNFHPHAYKSGDSISSSDHALSYGLMDASNNAVITTNLTNTTPSSSTLGVNHSLVHIDSFADATFTKMLVLDNIGPHWHRFNSISDLDAKFRLGHAQDDTSWEDNATYSADARQSGATTSHFVFNTRFTAGDTDFGRMGLTDNASNTHDVHNDASEYEGISSFNDSGAGAYLSGNDDTALSGTEGYLSIWVAE